MASVLSRTEAEYKASASVETRGKKLTFLALPQYAPVLEPRQNDKNNRYQKPFLH